VDLAVDVLERCESGKTPLPIGVGRNGILVWSINLRIATSAWAYAAPFPTMTKGALADFSKLTTTSIFVGSAPDRGGAGTVYAVVSSPSP
jgi:hypothetical protein